MDSDYIHVLLDITQKIFLDYGYLWAVFNICMYSCLIGELWVHKRCNSTLHVVKVGGGIGQGPVTEVTHPGEINLQCRVVLLAIGIHTTSFHLNLFIYHCKKDARAQF